MIIQQARIWPQPTVAFATVALALLALLVAALVEGPTLLEPRQVLLLVVLSSALVAAYRFPIHLRAKQKVELTTVALYLIAVLTPAVAPGVLAAGAGLLLAELSVRARRGNLYSDVATAVGRYMIIVLVGATVARSMAAAPLVACLLAALVMLLLDFLTLPVLIAPASGERLSRVIFESARLALPIEAAQYLLGLIGAILAQVALPSLILLLPPLALLYLGGKKLLLRERDRISSAAAVVSSGTTQPALLEVELAALTRSLGEHGPQLYRFVLYQSGDRALADEVLATVFERARSSGSTGSSATAPSQLWLFKQAHELLTASGGHASSAFAAGIEAGFEPRVATALAQLGGEQREVLVLRTVLGWPSKQIADLLGCPTAVVLLLQYSALRRMARLLS